MHVSRDFSHFVRTAGEGVQHIDLAVEGVHCAGCMAKIERGLSAIPDVTLARVNLTDRRVALEWKAGTLDPARFIRLGRGTLANIECIAKVSMMPGGSQVAVLSNGQKLPVSRLQSRILRERFLKL